MFHDPDDTPVKREAVRRDGVQTEFFKLGTEYYVTGRFGYYAFAHPVAAATFHHAVEMLLKGYLVRIRCARNQSAGLRAQPHEALATRHQGSERLGEFTAIVTRLDQFEDLRYPDKARAKYSTVGMVFGPKASERNDAREQRDRHGEFHLDIDEMDRLVVALFKLASQNPHFYSSRLSAVGVGMLKENNREAAFWEPTPVT